MDERKTMEIVERKLLRGNIIDRLYDRYGEDLRIAVLRNLLRTTGLVTERELQKAVFYLGGEEKRYIHVEVNEDNWLDSLIWLTPVGVNLAEGDITDVGVENDG